MTTLVRDLRFAVRVLVKDRSFTVTALLTLAICIAANTAMFSVVRSVLLKPLPFPKSGRVVLLTNSYPNAGAPRVGCAVPDYFDRLSAVPALDVQAVFRTEGATFGDEGGAERLVSFRATPSFFHLVQTRPAAGRIFTDDEGNVGKHFKALLSHGFAQRKFGGAAQALGRTMRLNGTAYEVVGVMPQAFTFLQDDIDVYVPAAFAPGDKADDRRHSNNWQMVGRLAPGATLQQVQQQIDALNAANDRRFPEFHQILQDAKFHTTAVMLQEDVVRDVRGVLYLLWAGVLFVLVIGCVNIANLVMVRASGRTREMATRHAIGGDLGRLARQLLTETMLLSIVGGLLGVLAGWWALRSLASLNLDQLPRGYEIALDLPAVGMIAALTLVVGILIGVAPVVRLRGMNLNVELREDSRGGTSGRRANLLRRVLAAAQVALALMLLAGAGLLFASFRAVLKLDAGFQPADVITATISLPAASYKDDPALIAFEQRALQAIRGIPAVVSAGGTNALPFSGNMNSNVILAEGYVMKPGESLIAPMNIVATSGYFDAMRIPVVRGRVFDARDTSTATHTAVIDERLAHKFWPDRDPVGRRLYRPSDIKDIAKITPQTEFFTVVGVVKEVQQSDPRADFTPVGTYYFPYEQDAARGLTFTVRTAGASGTIVNDIRRAVASIDPEVPVFRTRPMREWIDRALVGRRLPMLIAIAFAAVALFLSAVGIYGVLAYSVAERLREMGVRMALGGSGAVVFRLVLVDGLRVIAVGLAGGLAGSFFVGRVMKSQLFDVAPLNPAVLGIVTLTLSVVAVLAVSIPALRASRINPVVALSK